MWAINVCYLHCTYNTYANVNIISFLLNTLVLEPKGWLFPDDITEFIAGGPWNLNQNTMIFIQGIFGNVIGEMAAILFQTQYIKHDKPNTTV